MTMKKEKRLKEIEDEIKTEAKKKIIHIASMILQDKTIVEMVLDKEENKTYFATYKDNEIKREASLEIEEKLFLPYPADKDFLTNDVILFPSAPMEYVNQKELIKEIQCFIHKYLAVSDFFEKICTYYVLFSWIYDDFKELPYLRGLGDYGTGKSRFLKTIGSVCYHPIFTSGATTVSPIFRMLNDFKGTLVLDEADLKISDTTTELVKILNCGFAKGTPVLRSEGNGKSFDVKAFHVFGPKIIATRKLFDDSALESRMITEDMNQNFPRKDISIHIPSEFEEEALCLRNKLLMFRFRNKGKSFIKTEFEDRSIEPRLNQIAVPLMSVIDDAQTIKDLQKYIREYNDTIKTDRTLNYNYQILEAIVLLLDKGDKEPTIGDVTKQFNECLDCSDTITPKKMGYLLKKTLNLKTIKTRGGYVVSRDNKEKIEILRKRFGIELISDITNGVNNVNDVNDKKEDVQEIMF